MLVNQTTVTATVEFNGTSSRRFARHGASLSGGSIKGALAARYGAVQSLRTGLDQSGHNNRHSVKAAYNPTGLTGDSSPLRELRPGTISVAAAWMRPH